MTSESSYSLTSPWAEMWQNTEASATVLNAMLLSKYGEEALDWDPITIQLEIESDFHVTPAEQVMNKICALQLVMSSADFFNRIDVFLNVCSTLSDGDPFFQVFAPLETEEIAMALAIVGVNRDMLPFSPTIQRYVREVLKADGFGEDDYPSVFAVVFASEPKPNAVRKILTETILEPTAADTNRKNISGFLTKTLSVMFKQFNDLPGLRNIDDVLLEKGIVRALGEDILQAEIPTEPK